MKIRVMQSVKNFSEDVGCLSLAFIGGFLCWFHVCCDFYWPYQRQQLILDLFVKDWGFDCWLLSFQSYFQIIVWSVHSLNWWFQFFLLVDRDIPCIWFIPLCWGGFVGFMAGLLYDWLGTLLRFGARLKFWRYKGWQKDCDDCGCCCVCWQNRNQSLFFVLCHIARKISFLDKTMIIKENWLLVWGYDSFYP